MSETELRLSPEDQATIGEVMNAWLAVNPRERQLVDQPKDFAVPRELFERLADVYTRMPMRDEQGEWYLAHRIFVDPKFKDEHMMFKAVHVLPFD